MINVEKWKSEKIQIQGSAQGRNNVCGNACDIKWFIFQAKAMPASSLTQIHYVQDTVKTSVKLWRSKLPKTWIYDCSCHFSKNQRLLQPWPPSHWLVGQCRCSGRRSACSYGPSRQAELMLETSFFFKPSVLYTYLYCVYHHVMYLSVPMNFLRGFQPSKKIVRWHLLKVTLLDSKHSAFRLVVFDLSCKGNMRDMI